MDGKDKYFKTRPPKVSYRKNHTPKHAGKNSNKKVIHLNPFRRFLRSFKKNSSLHFVAAGSALVLLIGVLSFTLWFFTNKNAYEVYLGDELQGVIAKSKTVTESTMYEIALTKLAAEAGTNVKVKEEITFKPVHASKKGISPPDYVIGVLYKKWDYEIEASVINVNGTQYAILKTEQEAKDILNKIAEHYINKESTLVDTKFPNAEITKKYCKPSELDTADAAFKKLNISSKSTIEYTVKQGDSLSKIATSNGMSVEELLEENSNIDINTKLKIGQTLSLIALKPLVSVETTEEHTYPTVAKKEQVIQDNPDQYQIYSKVIQQGRDGQKEVTEHIIRINGFETEVKPISEKIIIEPVNEVIEVGTKNKKN